MAFTRIQGTGNASTSPSHSVAATLGGVTPGNLLVVIGNGATATTIADSQGNTWQTAVTSGRMTVWYAIVTAGMTVTVTVTSSQSNLMSLSVDEWSFAGSVAVDSTATGSGTSTSPATGNLTLSATDLVVAGFDVGTTGLTYTPGSGFTAGYTQNGGSSEAFASEYNAAQVTTPVAPGFTLSSSAAWAGVAAAFSQSSPSHLSATESHDTAAISGTCQVASLSRTESHDTPSIPGGFKSPASAAITEGHDTSAITGTCIVASLSATAWPDSFAGTANSPLGSIAVTERHDLAAMLASAPAGAIAVTGGNDQTVFTVGTFASGSTLGPTAGSDTGTIPALLGNPPGHLTIYEGADRAAIAGATTSSGQIGTTERPDSLTSSAPFKSPASIAVTAGSDSFRGFDQAKAVLARTEGGDTAGLAGHVVTIQYHVYANSGRGDPIDYLHPVDTTAMTTFASWGLHFPGLWRFAVRAFDVLTGLEEQNLDAQVTINLGGDGSDVSSLPDPPIGLLVLAVAGGKIRVEWGYPTIHGGNPTGFHVYVGTGGSPNYASPVQTVSSLDGIFSRYSTLISGLTTGITYSVGVRAFNAAGEEANTRFVNVLLKASAPRAVVNLTATATATG